MAAGLAPLLVLVAGPVGCADPTAIRQLATPPRITGHWQAAPHLGQELAVPILAPSNPQVAYELPAPSASGNGAAHGFQRTDDGGATWQALNLPQLPGPMMDGAIRISPVDAHNVFLQVDFGVPLNGDGSLTCPGSSAGSARPLVARFLLAPRSNDGNCPALFYSTDGGASWAPAHLPMPGELLYANPTWPVENLDIPQAQGGHLYAALQPGPDDTTPIGVRLMVSADRGATWQLADDTLFSQAPAICNVAVAPQSNTLFALTADSTCNDASEVERTVWRSDDGGTHWTKTGAHPLPVLHLLAAQSTGGTPLLYAITNSYAANPTLRDLQLSANGGASWQALPLSGVPSTLSLDQIGGVLSDGSLFADMLPTTSTQSLTPQPQAAYALTLYAWKPGDAAWHQFSPPLPNPGQPGYLLVAPGGGASAPDTMPDTIWMVSLMGNFQQPGATYAADALILS